MPSGNRSTEHVTRVASSQGAPRETMPRSEPLPAAPAYSSTPHAAESRVAPVAQHADTGAKIQEEPKPKRHWWRRTFGG